MHSTSFLHGFFKDHLLSLLGITNPSSVAIYCKRLFGLSCSLSHQHFPYFAARIYSAGSCSLPFTSISSTLPLSQILANAWRKSFLPFLPLRRCTWLLPTRPKLQRCRNRKLPCHYHPTRATSSWPRNRPQSERTIHSNKTNLGRGTR